MPTLQARKEFVRDATAADVPWLIGQLEAFDRFAGYKRPLLEDRVYAAERLGDMIRNHVVLIAAIAGEHEGWPNVPAGFIAGYRHSHPYNPKLRMLTETFWWVAPEHRRKRAGILLLDKFTELGRQQNEMVVMSLEHNSPVKDRHLLKRGYRAQETSYVLEA